MTCWCLAKVCEKHPKFEFLGYKSFRFAKCDFELLDLKRRKLAEKSCRTFFSIFLKDVLGIL